MKILTDKETVLISGGDYDEESIKFFCETGLIVSDICEKDYLNRIDLSLN